MKRSTLLGIVGAVALFATLKACEHRADEAAKREYVQGGYDYGVSVGRVIGMCDTLTDVRERNMDSAWAQAPETLEAITACEEITPKVEPGTRLTLPAAREAARL